MERSSTPHYLVSNCQVFVMMEITDYTTLSFLCLVSAEQAQKWPS